MQSYSEREIFDPKYILCMRLVERLVERLPDKVHGDPLRCHEVARIALDVIEKSFDVRVAVLDGHYGPVEHSWLLLQSRDPKKMHVILDPYAVGRLPPVQLVSVNLGHAALYRVGNQRDDIRAEVLLELASTVWQLPIQRSV